MGNGTVCVGRLEVERKVSKVVNVRVVPAVALDNQSNRF